MCTPYNLVVTPRIYSHSLFSHVFLCMDKKLRTCGFHLLNPKFMKCVSGNSLLTISPSSPFLHSHTRCYPSSWNLTKENKCTPHANHQLPSKHCQTPPNMTPMNTKSTIAGIGKYKKICSTWAKSTIAQICNTPKNLPTERASVLQWEQPSLHQMANGLANTAYMHIVTWCSRSQSYMLL